MIRVPWFGLFGRQVAREIIVNTSVALFAGLSLFVAVDFVETGNGLRQDAGFFDVLLLELYTLPIVAMQIAHLAAVIGATTATGALLRNREITAMFAAGAPPSILLKPTLIVGVFLALTHAAATEWMLPAARAEVTDLRRSLGLTVTETGDRQTWFKGQDHVFRVDGILDTEGRELAGVLMLDLKAGRLRARRDVERLTFSDGVWSATGTVRHLGEDHLEARHFVSEPLVIPEAPSDFVRGIGAPERMRYTVLAAAVAARQRLGQSVGTHKLELYRRHTNPLTLLFALALAVASMLRMTRQPSLALALAIGLVVGFGLWLAEEVGQALGSRSAVSPMVAAHAGLILLSVLSAAAWIRAFLRGVEEA